MQCQPAASKTKNECLIELPCLGSNSNMDETVILGHNIIRTEVQDTGLSQQIWDSRHLCKNIIWTVVQDTGLSRNIRDSWHLCNNNIIRTQDQVMGLSHQNRDRHLCIPTFIHSVWVAFYFACKRLKTNLFLHKSL